MSRRFVDTLDLQLGERSLDVATFGEHQLKRFGARVEGRRPSFTAAISANQVSRPRRPNSVNRLLALLEFAKDADRSPNCRPTWGLPETYRQPAR